MNFNIRAESYSEALIDFAIQADVSIGGASRCRGQSPGLSGRYTLEQALDRLLAGASCHYEFVDARTVRLLAGPAPAPPAARPARPAPPPLADIPAVGEVVVTATKRSVAFERAPASISAISNQQIALTGATDASGLVDQAVGVIMTNLGPGRDKILLRGLADGAFTGRTQSTVGTYLDEVPITYNAPDPDLRLADVDTVEIVRGPQGALYGGGSLSGVFRIVTRKPDPDRYSGQLSALGGWTEGGSPSREFEAIVNAPLVSGVSALRMVAYRDVDGGYLDDINLSLSNVDRTIRQGGRVAVSTRLGDTWSLLISANTQHLDTNDTQYSNVPGGPPLRRANRVRENHNNDFSQAAVTLTGAGDWGRFTSSTAYVRHAFSSQYDASAALDIFGASVSDLGVFYESAQTGLIVEDAVWTSPAGQPLQLLLGVYGSRTTEESPSTLKARSAGGPQRLLYEEQRSDHLSEGAIYGEVSWTRGPWTAVAGARVFHTDLETASDVMAPYPGQSRSFVKGAHFNGASPKLSLQYQFEDGNMVYALASEGHRAGGFNSGGLLAPSALRSGFQPDRLRNIEVGTKLRLFDRRLDLRTAVFYDVWTDIQTDQYFASGLSYTANIGDAVNLGWETELSWRPVPSVTLQLNTLLDAPKLTRVSAGFAAPARTGLPGAPDLTAGVLAMWRRPLRDDLTLLLIGEAGYVGRSRLTFDSAFSPESGGIGTGKLSAQLLRPRWRLAAYLSNPLNTTGDTFAYGNPFSFGQVRQVTPLRPRTFSLVLSASF